MLLDNGHAKFGCLFCHWLAYGSHLTFFNLLPTICDTNNDTFLQLVHGPIGHIPPIRASDGVEEGELITTLKSTAELKG